MMNEQNEMNKTEHRFSLERLFRLCPAAHFFLLFSAAVILLHLSTRGNYALNNWLSRKVIRPLHDAQALLNAKVPFSVAELLIALAVILVAGYLIYTIVQLIRRQERLKRLYRFVIRLAAAGLFVYAGFCVLWGVYYYGDDFLTASGLQENEISVEQLETVTEYFATLANEYGEQVPRNESGLYSTPRDEILDQSDRVYENAEKLFPCLQGPDVKAKGILCSEIMSLTDFTGFFFPFTAEANVNMAFPQALLASTVAHELAHQRGVAQEQEANFVAVMASLEYGDADYCYSACLLAYIHLGNALYKADPTAWEEVYATLNEGVRADLSENNRYWQQYETPVQQVSNKVYEGFLQSYDQELGLQSYGACVDLLVNYYYDTASAAASSAGG